MSVGEGKFVLYSRIAPPLAAGDYRFTATQELTASGSGALPVAPLHTHVTVRSPRFSLPPDQVLSTYPPAGSEGSYGSRLPQVVIRRRTLPWERVVQAGAPVHTPWLALVLIAEGEAELRLNQPVAECVTPGVTLEGKADSELGNYLEIRRSVLQRVFPTRADLPLLAHAREVDIHDTELMMGDDDGFLAVVIANRLPLPGRDAQGDPAPMKYLACLINMEGQYTSLLERAPAPTPVTKVPVKPFAVKQTAAAKATPYTRESTWSATKSNVYFEMARDFTVGTHTTGFVVGEFVEFDPALRFPVLLHWSFTSFGSVTFRSLMEGLDSGLLGTVAEGQQAEVVETGHIGLDHRTRRGDGVRSWYRGPLLPHPTSGERPPLAHAADQLRIIVPDGREDISLAAAFDIGRLLALSRPSMIAALMRWRQTGFQAARRAAIWEEFRPVLDELLGEYALDRRLGLFLGRSLAGAVTVAPEEFLGDPRPLATPGRPLSLDGSPELLLAKGFGLPAETFTAEPEGVLATLRRLDVARGREAGLDRELLANSLEQMVQHLAEQVRDVR